jgi:bis(5'-nucleosyl)-tetraphosphatase (symmetrical)
MATYAIGDVQGCFKQLKRLLKHIDFDPLADRLRFAGDLVNRGPRSLEVLRFVRALGDRAISVLGNHDLHLLAAADGERKASKGDTLDAILAAPDRDELLDWLRQLPLMHENPESGLILVHAGLSPQWSLETARRCAREVEAVLRGPQLPSLLKHMYGNEPRRWDDGLQDDARWRYIINAFTRMRYCQADGTLDFAEKNPPGRQAKDLLPWFAVPNRLNQGVPVVFGHWATLQLKNELDPVFGVHHIDTGCVWGGTLTALREDDGMTFSVRGWRV